jgi:Alr-MurF fusion protein
LSLQEYNINKIAEIVSGNVSIGSAQIFITDLVTDSRKLNSPSSSLFFALVTHRNDGHKYIESLAKQGVRNFCVNKLPANQSYEANFIVVEDTLEALQKLTAWHRIQFNIPVIGITGSNGKTIVKEWLWQLMSEEKIIVRSPKSYNSQIGVPLSVWQMNPLHNLAIFEAGISQPGEMTKLYEIIKPTIGIITNIGQAHDQFFDSHEQKTAEKLLLFQEAGTIVYNNDANIIHNKLVTLKDKTDFTPYLFSWGSSVDSSLCIIDIIREKRSTTIKGIHKSIVQEITIRFTDEASIENAIHCWSVMLVFGYGPEVIKNRMLKLQSVAMRLEMKEGINSCIIINDTYSSDPDSLANALDFLIQQTGNEKKTVILSDMLQSSSNSNQLYGSIASLLSQKKITRLIGIGTEMSQYRDLFSMQKQFFDTTDEFISSLNQMRFRNESILIKGARMFEFERINELLQQKSHETILEVNLNALVHNLNYFRSIVKPSTKIMVMVKAFSYGSGSFEIANTLQFHHADYLAVAYVDEGVELRKAGISLPIMVMNPELSGMEGLIRYNLEPEVYSFRTLDNLIKTVENINGAVECPINIHIKLDTGMHRLGFMEDDIEQLTEQLKKYPQIRVVSVFSHLAASEMNDLDWFTTEQISSFERMTWNIKESLGYSFMRHILNSAGIIRHPFAQFDMVRLGISLYGVSPLIAIQRKLEVVSSLKTIISQIKTIKEGDAVGYSCKWIAQKETTIAIVPVGYADGLGRKLGNGVGCMYVKNKLSPIIGSINMDMTILDITGIEAEEGDEVVIFGNEISLNKVAEQMETIPYEILTGISRRVKRIYFQE